MSSALNELEENSKDIFETKKAKISYALGFPILDQLLGCKYNYTYPDGSTRTEVHLGVPAGTFTMFLGASQSGKTTASIQAAWNIVEPFDEYAYVIHDDAEDATTYERIQGVTGADANSLESKYKLIPAYKVNTYDQILEQIVEIAKKKKADKKNYSYNTGRKDFWGKDIIEYKPTVIIMDSLMKFTSDGEETEEISDSFSGGREAVARGKFMRNALEYMGEYNINVFIIHHWSVDMRQGYTNREKQLPNLPTGKYVTGGDKVLLYCSSIILFSPQNSKDGVKTEDVNGYNGRPVDALLSKTRTSAGGTAAHLEFVQEAGFDPRLTLMNFAKEKKLIIGVNPKSKFACDPEVTFDTRKFIEEIGERPEIIRTLYKECLPLLNDMIPWMDVSSDDAIRGGKAKVDSRSMLRDMYSQFGQS